MMAKKKRKWLQAAREKMEEKGSVGSYGKSSPAKDKRNIAKGGVMAKKAQFAMNMRKAAARRKRRSHRRAA
jgi:hypothetical protein